MCVATTLNVRCAKAAKAFAQDAELRKKNEERRTKKAPIIPHIPNGWASMKGGDILFSL